ncbi:glycosyltransferase [Sporolactobacillus kofuensis]|uniref:Glycosyltransferase n=1 Tax=Sporolactobacillus kofuensis TaxID=269672 RepID=A0ABW1WE75_9BACL|nr:glycosyltransferase [Sporolactobacillus kofuensis]MCO7176155.1 glycosyltransferase [Sporolactobacillus kofuensis]
MQIIYAELIISLIIIVFTLSYIKENIFTKPLIILCCISNVVYIIWRIFFTFPEHGWVNWIAGFMLLLTECIGFLQMVIFYTLVWNPVRESKVPLEQLDHIPTVDLFIATYNEPVSILKKTLAGCKNIDYPKDRTQIYLCDDGDRVEVKKLAEQFGALHCTREDHMHAKAGNLNHALKHSTGEFIAIFDADMVPLKAFLTRTIGLFKDPKVAFVQTPQAFYNDDPYQYNTFSAEAIPNEQDFFMRTLQAGKARFNAVMFVGSNAIFRRTVLDEIGGFATGVITEDMATGMIIQSKGYKTLSVSDVLAMGLAPESWGDMLKQRDRWCRGNIQCAKKWNPLTMPGLSIMQRILYLDGLIYWFFGLFKMIYILAPLAFVLLGIYSLNTDLISILEFWLPSFLGSFLSFKIVSKGKRSLIWSHIYDTSMAPRLTISALTELFGLKQLNFKVTPKGATSGKREFHLASVLPHIVLVGLTLLAFIEVGVDNFVFHINNMTLFGMNILWAIYNLLGLLMALVVAFNQPRHRSTERFPINRDEHIQFINQGREVTAPTKIVDMSDRGARLRIDKSRMERNISFEQLTLQIEKLEPIKGHRVWIAETKEELTIGLQFDDVSPQQYTEIIDYLFNENESKRTSFESRRSHYLATSTRFMRHGFKKREPLQRQDSRHHIDEPAYLMILPDERIHLAALEAAAALSEKEEDYVRNSQPFEKQVHLVDLSLTGCQIICSFPMNQKARVIIRSNQAKMNRREAEVVWSTRKRGNYLTGLRFVSEKDQAELNHNRTQYSAGRNLFS